MLKMMWYFFTHVLALAMLYVLSTEAKALNNVTDKLVVFPE